MLLFLVSTLALCAPLSWPTEVGDLPLAPEVEAPEASDLSELFLEVPALIEDETFAVPADELAPVSLPVRSVARVWQPRTA